MKSAVNGGLQLSVLDGWWAEAYDGTNGWALSGDVDHDHGAQDARDAAELLRLLDDEVVPTFYDRDERGLPQRVAGDDARVAAHQRAGVLGDAHGARLRRAHLRLRRSSRGARAAAAPGP